MNKVKRYCGFEMSPEKDLWFYVLKMVRKMGHHDVEYYQYIRFADNGPIRRGTVARRIARKEIFKDYMK